MPLAEMIVFDANILIRAVMGRRVRQLLEDYAGRKTRSYAPDDALASTPTRTSVPPS
jgi:predicted nucleic acid-binding protein